jgi:GAF domain-containing protein
MQDLSFHDDLPTGFIKSRDDTVLQKVLYELGLVDAPPEDTFDRFTRIVAHMLDVPVALVSFVEEERDRQYFKSQIGLGGHWAEDRQTPLSHSFCQFVKRDNRPLVIEHAPDNPQVCDNLAIRDLNVRAYLGVPIHGPEGAALGALCAIEPERRIWTQEDISAMQDVAACVTVQIRQRAMEKNCLNGGYCA